MRRFEKQMLDSCKTAGLSHEIIDNSEMYAENVSQQILKYAKEDGYIDISNYPRYEPSREPGAWYPTPPAFIAAIEPYFNKVRSFTLESADQFKPEPPVPFSTDPQSPFYKLMKENYKDVLQRKTLPLLPFGTVIPLPLTLWASNVRGKKNLSRRPLAWNYRDCLLKIKKRL